MNDFPRWNVRPEMAAGTLSLIVNREEARSYFRMDTERLKIAEEFIHVAKLRGGILFTTGFHYMDRLVDKYRPALEKQERSNGTAATFSNPQGFDIRVGKKVFDGLKKIEWAPIQEMIDRNFPPPAQQ